MTPAFKQYAIQVVKNAQTLAAALVERGYAIVSGGTDTHLMLVDLRPKGLTGKEAQALLDRAGITVNKNTIPGDAQSAFVTSGIRIGTPAVTTRGFAEPEMEKVADCIDTVLTKQDDATIARMSAEDLSVEFADGILTIGGERKPRREGKPHYHAMEVQVGPFERRFRLPVPVDPDSIHASYEHGFLEVRLTKLPPRLSGPQSVKVR